MKKLLALLMAVSLTFQLVTPVFAEEIEETQAATEAVEVETEAPVTEAPTTETPVPETAVPEETSAPTEPQTTTEVTEATASTEETIAATEPTEETTEPTLDLFVEDGNVIASGTCGAQGENLTWVLTEDGTLTISGSGEMKDYSDSSVAPWYTKRTKILSVVVEDGVTSIGDYAFYFCNMTSVTIPEGVTNIGACAFYDCSSLTNVTIPDSMTHIGYEAFCYCNSLANAYFGGSNADFSKIKIESGNYDLTDAVVYGSLADGGTCDNYSWILTQDGMLTVSGNGAIDTRPWYPYRRQITAIVLETGITNIGVATFSGCASLERVMIPGSVTSIGVSAFVGCSSLTSVVIPEGVKQIEESTFERCTKLENVRLPKTLKRVCDCAFLNCGSIRKVYYGSSQKSWNKIRIDNYNWDLKNAKRYYNVTEEPGVAEPSVKIYPIDTDYLVRGSKLALTVYKMPQKEEVDVRWSLDGDSRDYAYIDENGVLMAKSGDEVQKITVIATPTDGSPELRKTLWRLPPAKKISLYLGDKSVPEVLDWDIYDNATLDFYAEVQPEGALTQVTWSSNNPKVAAVAADGTVTLLKPGTAVIKATAADGSKVAAQVTLNVIYTDHSPKLGVSALNLNTAYSLGTTVDFVEQLGNQVEVVSVDDDRFDVSYEDNRLTLKAQEPGLKGTYKLTLEAVCADGRTYSYPLTVKAAPTLPRLTVKQTEKFNLFYRDSEVALTVIDGEVEEAELISSDFVLDNKEGQWVIRYADPENAPAKPNTKAILSVTFAGYSMPVTKTLTISAVNTAPKLTMNPTSSILNSTLIEDSTVETALFGAEGDNLSVWAEPSSVDVSLTDGVLSISLNEPKAVTASIYVQNDNWVKPVKLTHRITVTDKKPTVKLSAKGKLDVLNPASEIVYTPKLTNATGTITDVRLEGQDANLFNAEVVDGLIHLKLAKSGENYSTRKTYKVTPVVTLLGKDITAPTLSIKVTQSALKLAKLPNRTAYQSQTAPLAVKLNVTSPVSAEIGDVQLNAKTTAALRNALEAAGGIDFEADTVTFPASAYATLKPGRYTVILDVFPANAASDTKPTQAKFTLTVQK